MHTLALAMLLSGMTILSDMPSHAVGQWVVGPAYDLGQPIGLDAAQESKIVNSRIAIAKRSIDVCGKTLPVKSLKVMDLSQAEFLAKYNFPATRVGLRGSPVFELTINEGESTGACGDFEDPATHLLISGYTVVMETGNGFFPLVKQGK